MSNGIVVLLAASIALAGCGGSSNPEATPASATPTSQAAANPACGDEITTSITLTADMTCETIGLIVTVDGVTLDLAGHTLSGPGPGTRSWPLPNFDVVGIMVKAGNVTIRNGTVAQFGMSVLVNEQRNATIEQVTATGSYYGIYVYKGGDNLVQQNAVTDNVYGLHFQDSDGNRALDNALTLQTHHSPGGYGLYLYSSDDNWFEGNTIRENLNWGLWFSESTGNTVVRNNVIGNDPQISDDTGGNVYYDAQKLEGNYWSDYAGGDDNGDGVGDVPYTIGGPGRSTDIYPFVRENGWTDRTSSTLAPATPPTPPDVSPRAYVSMGNGDIAALALDSLSVAAAWHGAALGPLAISPDGSTLFALAADAEATNVVAFDTASLNEANRWEVPGAQVIAATYDGKRVIVSAPDELTEIVLATGELRRQDAGKDAVSLTPSWKHNIVLATRADGWLSVIYLPNQHAAYGMSLGGQTEQAVDNRAGTRLFVLLRLNEEVQVIDTEQFIVTDTVPLGDIDLGQARIAPSPDGTTLYVLDRGRARLRAIDLGTKRTLADLAISGRPIDLVVSADGSLVTVVVSDGAVGRALVMDRELRPVGTIALPSPPLQVITPR